jgi:hypothetical protein
VDRRFDTLALLSFGAMYAVAAYILAGLITRRFSADERRAVVLL